MTDSRLQAAHRPALAAFYLRVLAPSARRRLIDAVLKSIVALAQASVSCSDITFKKTPIYSLLQKVAKQLHWNNAQGNLKFLVLSFDFDDFDDFNRYSGAHDMINRARPFRYPSSHLTHRHASLR